MITIYLTGIPNYYEGEDIEIRYRIFEDINELEQKSFFKDYKKPALVGLFSLIMLLKDIEHYKDKAVTIVVNDPALMELIRGTSTNKDREVIRMANSAKDKLAEFNKAVVKNVSNNSVELAKWNELLTM